MPFPHLLQTHQPSGQVHLGCQRGWEVATAVHHPTNTKLPSLSSPSQLVDLLPTTCLHLGVGGLAFLLLRVISSYPLPTGQHLKLAQGQAEL